MWRIIQFFIAHNYQSLILVKGMKEKHLKYQTNKMLALIQK